MDHHDPDKARRQRRAIMLMLGCVLVFCLMDAVLKTLSAHYPPFQVAALRGASSLPWLVAWAAMTTGLLPLLRARWSLHLLRGAIGILMMAAFVYALRTLRGWGALEAGAALLGLYARVAAALLAALTATGVTSSLRRMPADTILTQLTDTAFGRALLAKVILMVVVAGLALWARIRLARAADPLSASSPARAEMYLLALVVAVSGLLTALPVPIRW